MKTYIAQYVLEPDNDTCAVSDWKEYFRRVKINENRPDVKQAIIDKLLTQLQGPFILIDYFDNYVEH